ncbi:bifunctional diguanylate cyclase/phosphodiesterase [Janthinobacterium sp. RB2R34]|uniref:bifunctional diguanylate cyclase/phosphodiesterase n=1 Tax=Janthinobacterium sp. RB2R34 TaxID=3424193 RepID=UPI003F221D90
MQKILRRVRISVSVSVLITMLAGLAITALCYVSARQIEAESARLLFQHDASVRTAALMSGLNNAVEQLKVLNQLFRSIDPISREQFRSFSAPLLQRYPEIQAFSYRRVLDHADRAGYEHAMRQAYPAFMIAQGDDDGANSQPAPQRDSYNVIDYVEPLQGNAQLLGLDTSNSPGQQVARLASRDSGLPTATELLTLTQYPGRQTGFLVLAPVYRAGMPLDTPEQRQRAVIGETAATFRITHLITTILGNASLLDSGSAGIEVFAGAQGKTLVYRHDAAASNRALPAWMEAAHGQPTLTSFNLAGQPWRVRVTPARALWNDHQGSLYVLLGGLLSTMLAVAYVYQLVSRNSVIERITGERTAALKFANLRLSEDIAARMQNEQSLRLRERIIEVSANAIVICSAEAPAYLVEYVNPAFERITGYPAHEAVGKPLAGLQGNIMDQPNMNLLQAAIREEREGKAILRYSRKDGEIYWSETFVAPVRGQAGDDGTVPISHFVLAQYDISAVMRFEAELAFQARHDILTGLANRRLLRERLEHEMAVAQRTGLPLWVVFIDLDRFKFVNDTLGHDAGDTLLKGVAERLLVATREVDTVARLGGDEFVLLLPQHGNGDPGMAILQRILETVAQPMQLGEYEFFLSCSMGVAVYPDDGSSAEMLIKHADIAMYRAKEQGRGHWQFYASNMNADTLERLSLESELRHALERDQFHLEYQPQLDLASGRMVGMEALLRWHHPQLGLISPASFIGLAEEMGLIIPIGDWVLRTACAQTRAWQLAGHGQLRVAVNLSARQFKQRNLLHAVAAVLMETGLDASCLELELTESMVMHDVEQATAIMGNLKALGVQLSIDDFGTGYSSLAYLRHFPIDVLKIDKSFVNDITHSNDDAAIVCAIISLAHNLRLKVIAEGVETAPQLEFLRAHGCDQMQGYLFSRPLGVPAFEALLHQGRILAA